MPTPRRALTQVARTQRHRRLHGIEYVIGRKCADLCPGESEDSPALVLPASGLDVGLASSPPVGCSSTARASGSPHAGRPERPTGRCRSPGVHGVIAPDGHLPRGNETGRPHPWPITERRGYAMSDSWQVVGQRQSSVRGPSGGLEDAMVVSFKTAKGNMGQITVPMSQYNPATVHELVDAQATQIDAVSALTGSTPPPSPESSVTSP